MENNGVLEDKNREGKEGEWEGAGRVTTHKHQHHGDAKQTATLSLAPAAAVSGLGTEFPWHQGQSFGTRYLHPHLPRRRRH